jgi:hypothetical protein
VIDVRLKQAEFFNELRLLQAQALTRASSFVPIVCTASCCNR